MALDGNNDRQENNTCMEEKNSKTAVLKLRVRDTFEPGQCVDCPIAYMDEYGYICPLLRDPDTCPIEMPVMF